MNIPENLLYTESHEWTLVEGETATIGITDHAQNELGDVVFVQLPAVGRTVSAGESVAVVESVKAASDIYAPIAGEVVEVNEALPAEPGLLNREPFGAAWLFKIRPASPPDLSKLKSPADYAALIGGY